MRIIILFLFYTTLSLPLFGQNITYNIPEGYEDKISKDDFKIIVDLSVPIVNKRFSIDYVKDGAIQLKNGQDIQKLNLHNLIEKCNAVKDKSQWDKVIQEHFDNLFAAIDEKKKINPSNFETIKKYLSLRIYPEEVVNQKGGAAALVTTIDLEGTFTLLMLDLPGAFTSVDKEMFKLWNLNSTTVFEAAQENINKQQIEKVIESFDVDSVTIEVNFLGNEDYAASYALGLLDNSPELVGEWGSAVAIPNKGLVEICKISKNKPVDFVKFIQLTQPFIEKSFREHEQPVSDYFYWYFNRKFTRINVLTNSDGSINIISPFGLTELMTDKK